MANRRALITLALAVLVFGALAVVYFGRGDVAQPPPAERTGEAPVPQAGGRDAGPTAQPVAAPSKLDDLYIGRGNRLVGRRINTVLTTRKGDAVYQVMVRYDPEAAPLAEVPGVTEMLPLFARWGKKLPSEVLRIDEETEMLSDTLGEVVRSVSSYRAWLNPIDRRVIAFELAQTTGGTPQRSIGHLSPRGVQIVVFRGADVADRREVPLAPGTLIPIELELIHDYYQAHKEAREKRDPLRLQIFIPGFMSTVLLSARPLDDQVVGIQASTFDCARYEVHASSAQAAESSVVRQVFWFDKVSGLLMRREDLDPSVAAGDAPVTERASPDDLERSLSRLRPIAIRGPALPVRRFPYALDKELRYAVRARDADIGNVRFAFLGAEKHDPGAYFCTATVKMNLGGSTRHETAKTWFDPEWRPVAYDAEGEESAEVTAAYRIGARLRDGKFSADIEREIVRSEPIGADSPSPAPPIAPPLPDATAWKEPLRPVAIPEDSEEGTQDKPQQGPRLTRYNIARPLSENTFLYDFNRVEHLAAIACRLPLPKVPKPEERAESAFQSVALFSVRQNRCGLLLFEIRPEPKPVLTKAQQRRRELNDEDDPQLYIATAMVSLLPCRMLLTEDGRLLELTLNYGSGDVTYTLDDPIMRRRAERASQRKAQEGPQLVRPPWW